MPIDKQVALQQMDQVICQCEILETTRRFRTLDDTAKAHLTTRMLALIKRLAPPGSVYLRSTQAVIHDPYILFGVVKALRDDYAGDCLNTYQELVNAGLLSDFLEMAARLIQDENLKQPAAVLAGGVLEEHLRKLCSKHGEDTITIVSKGKSQPKKADTMNADLVRARAYGKNEQKQITAWLGIRNSAAHAKYNEFDDDQVRLMIQGLRDFIAKYPA